jgi:hypothetical protein
LAQRASPIHCLAASRPTDHLSMLLDGLDLTRVEAPDPHGGQADHRSRGAPSSVWIAVQEVDPIRQDGPGPLLDAPDVTDLDGA